MPTNTYVALDKKTIGTAASTVTFTSIPSTYTDLIVIFSGIGTTTDFFSIRLNGDTGSNYSLTDLYGNGSNAYSTRQTNQTKISRNECVGQSNAIININNYANTTTYKTTLARSNAAGDGAFAVVGLWRSTAAINSISLIHDGSSFATGSTFSLYGIKKWTAEETPKATGGYVYSDSTYWYHTFLSSGTFTPNQSLTCDYLVVAGGAGGSYDTGGGGGAGGLRSTVTATGGGGSLESALSVTSQGYTITVGAGGAGALTGSRRGGNGSDSTFSSITSTGGGSGGTAHGGGLDGSTGGSGGGGSRSGGNGGARVVGQGYAGGNGTGGTTGGGGGGGAGSAGTSASSTGGAGGNGVQISSVASATKTGVNGYYAGGGGGGSNVNPPAPGGLGGGGQGGTPGGQNIKPGVNNTGSGGGGCGGGDSTGNANGGSGIVIIRYTK
jgi:hypothetical protein